MALGFLPQLFDGAAINLHWARPSAATRLGGGKEALADHSADRSDGHAEFVRYLFRRPQGAIRGRHHAPPP